MDLLAKSTNSVPTEAPDLAGSCLISVEVQNLVLCSPGGLQDGGLVGTGERRCKELLEAAVVRALVLRSETPAQPGHLYGPAGT